VDFPKPGRPRRGHFPVAVRTMSSLMRIRGPNAPRRITLLRRRWGSTRREVKLAFLVGNIDVELGKHGHAKDQTRKTLQIIILPEE
jgi:hypothetical protein